MIFKSKVTAENLIEITASRIEFGLSIWKQQHDSYCIARIAKNGCFKANENSRKRRK